jgi:plastocyanin
MDETPATETRQSVPARWTKLAALGLFLAGLGPLMMYLAGLVFGLEDAGDATFFLIVTVIAWVGALLVWRFGTWSKFVGIIAALLVAGALFWTIFGLQAPTSFFDFMPGVLVIPGALIAIIASISAIVAKRRGHGSETAVGGERIAIRVVLGIVIVLAVISGGLTFAGISDVDDAAADAVVVMGDFEFDEEQYTFEPGTTVLVRNEDPFLHTFTVDDLDIDVTLSPGSEELVEIPSEPGAYVLYCRPHTFEPEDPSEDDMAAELEVR